MVKEGPYATHPMCTAPSCRIHEHSLLGKWRLTQQPKTWVPTKLHRQAACLSAILQEEELQISATITVPVQFPVIEGADLLPDLSNGGEAVCAVP